MEEKKYVNKKKITKKVLDGIIVLGAVFLFMIGFLLSGVTIKKNSDYAGKYKTLSEEEYKTIVKEYGDAATKVVEEYMKNNFNQLPEFDAIASNINIPNYSVSCSNRQVNTDGTIYLSNCTVRGYVSHYDYHYGTKGEATDKKVTNKTTDASSNKIYIYRAFDSDGAFSYRTDTKEIKSDRVEYVDTYTCLSDDCSSTHYGPNSCQYVGIIDTGMFYLYNPLTKNKDSVNLGNINSNYDVSIITNSNNIPVDLFVKKYDENKISGKGAFYSLNAKRYLTDYEYSYSKTMPLFVEKGVLAASKEEYNNNTHKDTLYFINESTGAVISTYDNILDLNKVIIGDRQFIYAYHPIVGGTYGSAGFLFNSNLQPIINLNKPYYYKVNSDNTITVTNNKKFYTLDLNGNILFESSEYTSIDHILNDYEVVRTDKEVLIVNQYGKTVSKFFDTNDNYDYYSLFIAITTINGEKAIDYMVGDKSVKDGVEGRIINYHYYVDSGKIEIIKGTNVPAHD